MVNRRPTALAVHTCLVMALVPALAAQRPIAPDRSADLFTDLYKRGAVKQRTLRSIHARFTETTTSSLLLKPIVAHGTVVAASPARVAMTYTDPEPKTLTMDATTLTIRWTSRPERQQINIRDIQQRVDRYFTHASVDELRSMFEIAARPDPALRHSDLIELTPKRKQIREGLERLEVWIDRDSDLLTQMRLTFPGGDQKTIALGEITLNVPVTDEMFRVK